MGKYINMTLSLKNHSQPHSVSNEADDIGEKLRSDAVGRRTVLSSSSFQLWKLIKELEAGWLYYHADSALLRLCFKCSWSTVWKELVSCWLQATLDCNNPCLKIDQGIPLLPKALKVLKCRPTDLPPLDNQANTCLYLHLIPYSARNVSESGWSTNQFILQYTSHNFALRVNGDVLMLMNYWQLNRTKL